MYKLIDIFHQSEGRKLKFKDITFRETSIKNNFIAAESDKIYTDALGKTSVKTWEKTFELIEYNNNIIIPEIADKGSYWETIKIRKNKK